jgi:hypothetical protein
MTFSEIVALYPNLRPHTTGGGCMALLHPMDNRHCLMITDLDGIRIPADDATHVLVGHYDDSGPVEYGEEGCIEIAVSELENWIDAHLQLEADLDEAMSPEDAARAYGPHHPRAKGARS